MKFTVTFKTPDALHDATDGINLSEEQIEEAYEFANQFIKYDELVTIEFDTVSKTATVLRK